MKLALIAFLATSMVNATLVTSKTCDPALTAVSKKDGAADLTAAAAKTHCET